MADHCRLLSLLLQQLLAMQQVVEARDEKTIVETAQIIDWATLADEFEPRIGRYKSEVRRHAQKLIRNLRRPYILYHDWVKVDFHRSMIVGAIKDSPSLKDVADGQIAEAWERDLRRDKLKGRQSREIDPILTIADLYLAAKWKLDLGLRLDGAHQGFMNCQRVLYSDLGLA